MIVVNGGTFIIASAMTTTSGRKCTSDTSNVLRMLSIFSEASKSPGSPMKNRIASVISRAGTDVHSVSLMCWYRSAPATAAARLAVSDSGEDLSPK